MLSSAPGEAGNAVLPGAGAEGPQGEGVAPGCRRVGEGKGRFSRPTAKGAAS